MKSLCKNSWIFVCLLLICFIASTMQSKKVNCRKYVYAPVCRGVAAKRDIPRNKFNNNNNRYAAKGVLSRGSQEDSSTPWRDKAVPVDDNSLLYTILRKLDASATDYDSDNLNYIK